MIRTIQAKLTVVFLVAATLLLAPTPQGRASIGPFIFYGSGFGHGIGMSQWGAYGLATKGWNHDQILTHYYSNTTIGNNANEPDKIRVGLVDDVQYVHLAAKNGPVK